MSLKAEIETWAAALKAYDDQDFEKSLNLFERIADTSKILCNIGLIYATLGEHESAVDNFNAATSLDKHLAVAYFQCGVSNFLLGRYEFAYKDFDEALVHLRENQFIDYDQLGLKFKLWSAEVLFNKGLCQIYLGNPDMGLVDLQRASKEKTTDEHSVIDDAIADRGESYTVFSIPVGILYRPSEGKLKNIKTKDYMGKAKLVAASEEKDAFTEFVGVKRLEQGQGPAGQALKPEELAIRNRAPPPEVAPPKEDPTLTRLGRSKTTAGPAPPRAVEFQMGPPRQRAGSAEDVLQRANTTSTVRPSPNGVPTRGLTITRRERDQSRGPSPQPPQRRPSLANERSPMRNDSMRAPPVPNKSPEPIGRPTPGRTSPAKDVGRRPSREENRGVMTQIYDDYLGGYEGGGGGGQAFDPLAAATDSTRRVAAWQSKTVVGASPNIPPSRAPSARATNSTVTSVRGGGTPVPVRKKTMGTVKSMSRYGDDEDDLGDIPFEQMKIRVKIHYDDDVRGMAFTPQTSFDEFVDMVTTKFNKRWGSLRLRFKDEDGGKISLKDEMDWDMAIEVARESVNRMGKAEAKLEFWMEDA